MRIGRQDGKAYRTFKRAVEQAGGTLALPFPTTATIPVRSAPSRAPIEQRTRRPRKALAV